MMNNYTRDFHDCYNYTMFRETKFSNILIVKGRKAVENLILHRVVWSSQDYYTSNQIYQWQEKKWLQNLS